MALYLCDSKGQVKLTDFGISKELENSIGLCQTFVGTFKYRNNANKQLKLIKSKYPITTSTKNSRVVLISIKGKKLYESRFEFFTKKEAYAACNRLKKYDRDCFVRL